jgi:hypothetical protein
MFRSWRKLKTVIARQPARPVGFDGTPFAIDEPNDVVRLGGESVMGESRVHTEVSNGARRRRALPAPRPDSLVVEQALQWITARIPPVLVREIEAHAKHAGTTRSEAIRECLAVGIETIRHRDGVPRGRVDELLGAIEGVRLLLELLGPPTLGTQRLLAHWASRDGAVRVTEEELLAELRNVSADEWEQVVVEAERDLSAVRNLGPDAEEG